MGGHYATTNSDETAFDPRPVKVGDVLYTILWRNGFHTEEPTIIVVKVAKVEQVGMQKFRDQVEETWQIDFEGEHEHIGPRQFKINAFSPSYTPFFWTSKEEVEAAARAGIVESLGYVEEEIKELEAKVAGIKALIEAPLKYMETEDADW